MERHKIIVLCLPSHTTHRLQPCDVGVFGPLNSTWKAEVNKASSEWIPIRKDNLLSYYLRAREKAFTGGTIQSAFHKTGIWPFDRDAIEDDAFAPALNTTTQSAQPIPTTIPDLLVAVTTPTVSASASAATPSTPSISTLPDSSAATSTASTPEAEDASDAEVKYVMANMPVALLVTASRDALTAQNTELRYLLDRCCSQMQRDFALKKLMDKENERLRKQLFDKSHKPSKKQSTLSRHMASEESLDALAREEWGSAMKIVFKDRIFKARRDAYEKYCRNMAAEDKAREKDAEKARKDAEKAQKEAEKSEERRRKEIEKFRLREQRNRQKEREKALKDAAKLQKAAEAAAAKAERAALADTRRAAGRMGRQRRATRPVANVSDLDDEIVQVVEHDGRGHVLFSGPWQRCWMRWGPFVSRIGVVGPRPVQDRRVLAVDRYQWL